MAYNSKLKFVFILLFFTIFCISNFGCGLLNDDEKEKPNPDYSIALISGNFPHVSPDGEKIVFSRSGNIFVCDTNGMNAVQLTSGSDDIIPQWSPDGKKIGFLRKNSFRFGYGTLMVVDTINKLATPLSATDSVYGTWAETHTGNISLPPWEWSPIGNMVAYYTGEAKAMSLTIIRSDGSGMMLNRYLLHTLKNDQSNNNYSGFHWSSDGTQILCTSDEYRDTSFLYIASIGNDTLSRVASKRIASFPCWSPDNKSFVFTTPQEGLVCFNRLTNFESVLVSSIDGSAILSPRISPDGKKAAYYYYFDDDFNIEARTRSEIRVLDLSTGIFGFLVDADWNYNFAWHPSGRIIYFMRNNIIRKIAVSN